MKRVLIFTKNSQKAHDTAFFVSEVLKSRGLNSKILINKPGGSVVSLKKYDLMVVV
jgi:hypothetical protein